MTFMLFVAVSQKYSVPRGDFLGFYAYLCLVIVEFQLLCSSSTTERQRDG